MQDYEKPLQKLARVMMLQRFNTQWYHCPHILKWIRGGSKTKKMAMSNRYFRNNSEEKVIENETSFPLTLLTIC